MFTFTDNVAHNYVMQVDCFIFHPGKFEQTMTHKHVLLWRTRYILKKWWWRTFFVNPVVVVRKDMNLQVNLVMSNLVISKFWLSQIYFVVSNKSQCISTDLTPFFSKFDMSKFRLSRTQVLVDRTQLPPLFPFFFSFPWLRNM